MGAVLRVLALRAELCGPFPIFIGEPYTDGARVTKQG